MASPMLYAIDNGRDYSDHAILFVATEHTEDITAAIAKMVYDDRAHMLMAVPLSDVAWFGKLRKPIAVKELIADMDWKFFDPDDANEIYCKKYDVPEHAKGRAIEIIEETIGRAS